MSTIRDAHVVNRGQLETANEFQGYEQGDTGISMIFVDAPPGGGPSLHRHDYDEVFIVQEGEATITAGEREIEPALCHRMAALESATCPGSTC